VNASKTHPLLAVAVQIDFAELNEVIQRCDALPQLSPQPGITIFDVDVELLEAVVRLLRLLDTPEHSKPLAPLARQEILYRLLSGPSGSRLLEICRNGSPSNRIAEATDWIKKHFAESFMVGELAHQVGMSPTSFHQHFKAVTGMTPIQYQRRIRGKACLSSQSTLVRRASESVMKATLSSARTIVNISVAFRRMTF
jgi:AraC-like DNA-binding protein